MKRWLFIACAIVCFGGFSVFAAGQNTTAHFDLDTFDPMSFAQNFERALHREKGMIPTRAVVVGKSLLTAYHTAHEDSMQGSLIGRKMLDASSLLPAPLVRTVSAVSTASYDSISGEINPGSPGRQVPVLKACPTPPVTRKADGFIRISSTGSLASLAEGQQDCPTPKLESPERR